MVATVALFKVSPVEATMDPPEAVTPEGRLTLNLTKVVPRFLESKMAGFTSEMAGTTPTPLCKEVSSNFLQFTTTIHSTIIIPIIFIFFISFSLSGKI